MSSQFQCKHENDVCQIVMVAKPDVSSIILGNHNVKESLYREPVNPSRAQQQHRDLARALHDHGVQVIDIMKIPVQREYDHAELANIIFTRDPLLVTAKGVVVGRFRESVRRVETEITQNALRMLNVPVMGTIDAPGYVEGGDFIPAGEVSFIACGNRTNREGIQQMLDRDMFGTDVVAIVEYPEDGLMKAIHLDCYLGLVGRKHAVVWERALSCTRITEMRRIDGGYEIAKAEIALGDYLTQIGYTVVPVDDGCQERYGCNLLDLGNNVVLTQDHYVSGLLMEAGYNVCHLEFDEIHKMYGGIRCATQTLQR